MSDWNDRVIAEFRATGGEVAQFGRDLVIMHTIGAKSGEERLNPVMGIRDGDAWLVTATMAGAPTDPAWAHNLRAHPDLDLEVAEDDGAATVRVHATELPEPARSEAWERFTERSAGFRDYATRTDRVFPIFRLARRG